MSRLCSVLDRPSISKEIKKRVSEIYPVLYLVSCTLVGVMPP